MLHLENPGSTGNSNHPVLGELGPVARAVVSITGIKLEDAYPVVGEMSLCLITQRAVRSNSLRVCDFCGPLSKKPIYHPKAVLLSTLAPQLLCSWLSAWTGKGPDVG